MDKSINPMDNYRIRFTGTAEINEPLNANEEFSVAVERMCCKDIVMRPNEDGTETYTYKLCPTSHAQIISREKVIFTKDPSKASVRLRRRLWGLANENGENEQEFYDNIMRKFICYADEVIEFLKDKN